MNLLAAAAIIGGFWLLIHWFGKPKKAKIVKMYDDTEEPFFYKQ